MFVAFSGTHATIARQSVEEPVASSTKKVIVRQFDGTLVWGYLPPSRFVRGSSVEVFDPSARIILIDLSKIKSIAYVKDFNLDDSGDPERIGRRGFLSRPRSEGLWLKLEFRDRDTLEGLTQVDLPFLDAVGDDQCLSLSLPDPKSNTTRLLVPRGALTALHVMGWIGPQAKPKPKADREQSGDLFPEV
jgi:hypothetical protein